MERKNTVLLTVIAVATLLVAVIGATFAYFTATAGGSGTTPVSVQTSSSGSSTFTSTSLTKASSELPSTIIFKYFMGDLL